jgi:hypothetical protein
MAAPLAINVAGVSPRLPVPPQLALVPGQVLEALVVGQTPQGLTQLAIGSFSLAVQLPQPLPPGTALTLVVQSGGPTPQLALSLPHGADAQPAGCDFTALDRCSKSGPSCGDHAAGAAGSGDRLSD